MTSWPTRKRTPRHPEFQRYPRCSRTPGPATAPQAAEQPVQTACEEQSAHSLANTSQYRSDVRPTKKAIPGGIPPEIASVRSANRIQLWPGALLSKATGAGRHYSPQRDPTVPPHLSLAHPQAAATVRSLRTECRHGAPATLKYSTDSWEVKSGAEIFAEKRRPDRYPRAQVPRIQAFEKLVPRPAISGVSVGHHARPASQAPPGAHPRTAGWPRPDAHEPGVFSASDASPSASPGSAWTSAGSSASSASSASMGGSSDRPAAGT